VLVRLRRVDWDLVQHDHIGIAVAIGDGLEMGGLLGLEFGDAHAEVVDLGLVSCVEREDVEGGEGARADQDRDQEPQLVGERGHRGAIGRRTRAGHR